MTTRRSLLATSATLTLLAPLARYASAAAKPDARFVLVILRGGLDGLAAVPPYGEPRYRALRGALALDAPGGDGTVRKLDGTFGLHPALANVHAMYLAREALVLHATATPYRERSHFDAQNVLEAGSSAPSGTATGWLNRAAGALAGGGTPRAAVALADSVPLVLRGEFGVTSWAPSRLPGADEDTLARVLRLYEAADPQLAARLTSALGARELIGETGESMGARGPAVAPLATAAARFLASDDGPRIAAIDIGGWDTHANQGAARGNLAERLGALDSGLQTLKAELGDAWRETCVAVVTEFGRTVAVNGTRGTDHGTAGCALLLGGAVAGGRVLSDWPGLAANALYEGRDLQPTVDLRAAFKGLLAERFGLAEGTLARTVFPATDALAPLAGLTV